MAKTESTAVNELIDLVQNAGSTGGEPAGDLFDEQAAAPMRVPPPRMTTTVPAMRGAGEVAPLPPRRAPQSTATHQQVRMHTASATRGTTIPPLSQPKTRASVPPPIPSRTSSQQVVAAPPPVPSRTKSQEMAAAPRGTAAQPAVTPPPIPARASTSSYVQGDIDVELDWDAETVAKPREEVTHSSPTLPSPRVTQPSFPTLPQQSRPTLPMPRQSAPKLPPPRKPPRGSEPPQIGEPFVARSLMSDDPTPVTDERTPVTDERTPVTAEKIDIDALVAKPESLPPPVAKARAKSEPPPPYTAKLTPLVFEPTAAVDFSARISKEESTWVGRPSRSLARKLVIPAVAATLIGIAAGAYVVTQSKQQHQQASAQQFAPPSAPAVTMKESAPETLPPPPPASTESPNAAAASAAGLAPEPPSKAEAAAPALAAEAQALANAADPAAEPSLTRDVGDIAPTPAPGIAKLVDVRIDSNPPGATAVLVDDGKTLFLGTTPLATSLDPSRGHDIVVSYDGRATQMVHVDASKETRINVALKRVGSSRPQRAQATVVATPAVADAPKVEAPKATAPKADASKVEAPTAAAPKSAAPKAAAPADATGQGTLMISSKPPCEIFIDGKPTGLTTPQRSIPLSVGTHKITLVNEAEGIKKTLPVTISPDKPTKLIQDLMQK